MTEWVCRWKPFWIRRGDTFQKAYLEEWEHVNDERSHDLGDDKPHRISRRKHSPSCQEYHFEYDVPNRLTEQKRLSVYNWNPGPRRGKERAIEKHIAVKWHIIILQEAIEYLGHEILTNRFHVTHYGGCAILCNKDTFFSDIKVTSIYLPDLRGYQQDKVKEGESGWVLQGVISRASPAATRWQIVLHSDVVAHQQQLCQKAPRRKEATADYSRCDA